jgi:hypothetical protein
MRTGRPGRFVMSRAGPWGNFGIEGVERAHGQ